jgi:8-oxo-dGTP pyrophosphatase MutT (NUDIX family)
MTAIPVVRLSALDMTTGAPVWRFAVQRRAEIDVFFDRLKRDKPALWNGRILMLGEHALDGDTLRGRWFETDYASMLAWKAWGTPDLTVRNGFAQGALRGSCGGFLLGVMGPHTANAGRTYFPSGTPDPGDVTAGRVDLAGSVLREVEEETGLEPVDFAVEPGWHMVDSQGRLALIQVLTAPEPADALRARILGNLRREAQPELSDIRIVRRPADLDSSMPDFVSAFLTHIWA